jgi:two-component system response regulator RegA
VSDLQHVERPIMIVDDDAAILAMMERLVAQWGFSTVPFGDFEAARRFLLTRPALHALVVDVRLGEYNGLQLIHLARQQMPEVQLIAVSGFDDGVLREEATRLGAKYIIKPAELLEDLRGCLTQQIG